MSQVLHGHSYMKILTRCAFYPFYMGVKRAFSDPSWQVLAGSPGSPLLSFVYSLFPLILFFFVVVVVVKFIYLFIFGCVGSSFLCEGFLQFWQAGATLHRGAQASPVVEHRLQTRRLSSCGSRAQPLCGMWDLPRPGLEPMCPALAGRFSTTAPPGKPLFSIFLLN